MSNSFPAKKSTPGSATNSRGSDALPWVRVEKDYRFDTDDGEKPLLELFEGRSQLLRGRLPDLLV